MDVPKAKICLLLSLELNMIEFDSRLQKGSARFGDLFKKFAHCNLFTISVHSLKKISLIYATHEENPFGIKLNRICDSLLILNDNGVSRGQ